MGLPPIFRWLVKFIVLNKHGIVLYSRDVRRPKEADRVKPVKPMHPLTPPWLVEGGVERDGDGDEDGGEEDEDVPARLGHAVVAEHPPGALRHRRLVLGQRLDVGGRRAEQRLQSAKEFLLRRFDEHLEAVA